MELQPGHGVFFIELDLFKRKHPSSALRHRNLVCTTCMKGREQYQKLYWCVGCNAIPYCSKECQKADWPEHQGRCQRLRQTTNVYDMLERALCNPKILHYLRIALVIETKLLDIAAYRRPSARFSVNLEISLDPPEDIRRKMQTTLVNQFNDVVLSGRKLVIPQGDDVVDLENVEGCLSINPRMVAVPGKGGVKDDAGIDLWTEARKTQQYGWTPDKAAKGSTSASTPPSYSTSTSTHTYTVQPAAERIKNPVILTSWKWGGIRVTNAIEITPDALRDAKRRVISDEMRIAYPWEDLNNLEPHCFGSTSTRLMHTINLFMRVDESLGLKSKLGTYDKRIQVEHLLVKIIAGEA